MEPPAPDRFAPLSRNEKLFLHQLQLRAGFRRALAAAFALCMAYGAFLIVLDLFPAVWPAAAPYAGDGAPFLILGWLGLLSSRTAVGARQYLRRYGVPAPYGAGMEVKA